MVDELPFPQPSLQIQPQHHSQAAPTAAATTDSHAQHLALQRGVPMPVPNSGVQIPVLQEQHSLVYDEVAVRLAPDEVVSVTPQSLAGVSLSGVTLPLLTPASSPAANKPPAGNLVTCQSSTPLHAASRTVLTPAGASAAHGFPSAQGQVTFPSCSAACLAIPSGTENSPLTASFPAVVEVLQQHPSDTPPQLQPQHLQQQWPHDSQQLQQQQQQHIQPGGLQRSGVQDTAASFVAAAVQLQSGFTPGQLVMLRNQIMAFRRLKARKDVEAASLQLATEFAAADAEACHLAAQQASATAAALQLQPARVRQLQAAKHTLGNPRPQQHLRPVMLPQQQPQTRGPPPPLPLTPQQAATQAQAQVQRVAQQQAAAASSAAAIAAVTAAAQEERAILSLLPRPVLPPLCQLAATRAPPVLLSVRAVTCPPQVIGLDVAALMQGEYQRVVRKARTVRVRQLDAELETLKHASNAAEQRVRLQVEVRAVRLADAQAAFRARVEAKGAEIAALPDRVYRKFIRFNLRQREDMVRKEEKVRSQRAAQRISTVKALRSEMSERAGAARENRAAEVRGMEKAHARLAREANKAADDMRARRMEALKANDFEAYQEMLREPGAGGTGAGIGSEARYHAVSKFLEDTEAYIHNLAGKVASVKLGQEASEAAAAAVLEARATGATEEEVKAAAAAAASEAAASSDLVSRSRHHVGDAQSRYYSLAHSVGEVVKEAPRTLVPPPGASLREYQMVGLQWMVSLYNNHLNGILADEMGLGKTVQVMALIAYLMESKGNYGPHLIIVPNAVMVNWKSELQRWLPGVRCIYYVGTKDVRAKLYAAEVAALQFNVLVTTFEYIMRDRARLSKVEWKYLIIDEAQRMKDRQSKMARDLDRFTAHRRLLLTGTPLQNDLRELWSLLNLLLPSVFDDKSMFHDWFGDALGSGGSESQSVPAAGEEWLATEKRVVVIHRLHQILEPFMLRRQVQDVEGSLPDKVAVVVKCAMTPLQSAVYNWVKMTGTLRQDPMVRQVGRTHREYITLNNKCMELRKICNHPMLSYPAQEGDARDADALARQCGKLVVLDRMLVKLRASGHRVLLFSTMTRLLDLLQAYLAARELPNGDTLPALRIDGSTSLEDREKAIQQFNAPDSKAFIFLLSIRAAGRGLNLQSADTVVIYDPDPNPKNEEQAIARSHRIGQTRQVRVIHLEAVTDVDAFSVVQHARSKEPLSYQGGGGSAAAAVVANPKQLYADSIESLVRNKIQKMKIDMANEVIDAGRFDMQTSMAERKETLEQMLQDEASSTRATNEVPDASALNAMLARGPAELAQFTAMDADPSLWLSAPALPPLLPQWLLYDVDSVHAAVIATSKQRPDQVAELAALVGQAGIFDGGSGGSHKARATLQQRRDRATAAAIADHAALGKRRTKAPSYKDDGAQDLAFLGTDDEDDDGDDVEDDEAAMTAAAADDAEMEEDFLEEGNLLRGGATSSLGATAGDSGFGGYCSLQERPFQLGDHHRGGIKRHDSLASVDSEQPLLKKSRGLVVKLGSPK